MAKFLKFIVNTILFVAIVVAAGLLIPSFVGVTTLIIDDVEIETNLDLGSVTYALEEDAGGLAIDDKILLMDDNGKNVYRVATVGDEGFILKDEYSVDGEYSLRELSGKVNKVVLTVPYVGYVSMALKTTEGLIIVGLSVVFVIILFILAEVWRSEEDEEEEEEEETASETETAAAEGQAASETASETTASEETQTETQEEEETAVQTQETGDAESSEKPLLPDDTSLFEETSSALAADVAMIMGVDVRTAQASQTTEQTTKSTRTKAQGTSSSSKGTSNSKEKIIAMPGYTMEELVEKANAMGDSPELVQDDLSGITLLDYSDIL